MIPDEIRQAIESILMVAEQPVEPSVLAQLLEVPKAEIEAACAALAAEYAEHARGFVLVQVAGGYRFQSHPDLAPYVERFVLEGQSSRLSAAALETLAIVAYKQPISRMQIAAIRGVSVDGVLRTLQQREYVNEVARDPGPGNAVLFGTTNLFLERVGLNSLDDLPPLAEFVPGADVVEALEEGLRPDPLPDPASSVAVDEQVETDVPAEADAMAEADDQAETVEPAERATTGEAHDPYEAAEEVEIDLVDHESDDHAVSATAAPDGHDALAGEPELVTYDASAPRSVPATTSRVAVVRHTPEDAAEPDPEQPFRPAPDDGGTTKPNEPGVALGEESGAPVASQTPSALILGASSDDPPTAP
jgi:segregation and condensation protein B